MINIKFLANAPEMSVKYKKFISFFLRYNNNTEG